VTLALFLSWPVLGALTAGGLSAGLIGYLFQHRERPGARWFMLTLSFPPTIVADADATAEAATVVADGEG
jgi:hypothetical protein